MMEEKVTRKNLDIAQIRHRLIAADGLEYWRSLDELARTEEFEELLHREFPEQASELNDPVSRRNFLKLMGASLAFGGLTGCTIQPSEQIVPQVRAPEEVVPGKPLYYATAINLAGAAAGLLIESHMGRPTKVEGNPQHPASLGSTHPIAQASILDLYDPDRSRTVKNAGQISTWELFLQDFGKALSIQKLKKGSGLRVLSGEITSPTLDSQLKALLQTFPEARWHRYEAASRDSARAGSLLAYGEPVNTYYDFLQADVILSLDADFAYSGPGNVRYARDFTARRRVRDGKQVMNRLYMMESTPSPTGSLADHRLALRPGEIESLALTVARELGVKVQTEGDLPVEKKSWIPALVRDLQKNRGRSLVVAGDQQSATIHALAHAINQALGNVGKTVHYTDPLAVDSVDHLSSITSLTEEMQAGQVDLLVIVGGNPVFDAPADLDFTQAMQQVKLRVHLSHYEDETSNLCHWQVPESHYLESWSDARSHDGLVTILQPLIEPLYKSKSAHELISVMADQAGRPPYEQVRAYWQEQPLSRDFESVWSKALHDGFLPGTALPPKSVRLQSPLHLPRETEEKPEAGQLELLFRPDPLIWDGRFANNGWLQETPNPITKLTWDNAALISPTTAESMQLANEQVVELQFEGRTLKMPVWIVPGQADQVVVIHFGYGRTKSGRVGTKTGFNAYALRTTRAMWTGAGLHLAKSSDQIRLACTQTHHSMEGRELVRQASLEEFKENPHFARQLGHDPPDDLTLYDKYEYDGHAWGMVIDLNACIGCSGCTVACQAENNIPIVGKERVLEGREMSWIRVDRYYKGNLDDPEILHQPIPCMQCENAPCELVCPVAATSHSAEGLNDMTYNRCVGTRYCSNNCPYKVRRFNFFQYIDRKAESLKLQRNPDVTVRTRGVMEKCTYCVQRINQARIKGKKEGKPIRDNDITTACQQACPTQAIIFGDINDPQSEVARLKESPLNYGILTELNTRPRTTFLAALKNPNQEIIEG